MVTTGLSLFLTILILNLHHNTHKAPVPHWLCKILGLKKMNTENTTTGIEQANDAPNMIDANHKNYNDDAEHKQNTCHLSSDNKEAHKLDDEWRMAIRRIDRISFFVFSPIFIALDISLIMIFSYGDTTRLNREECTMS